MNDIINPVYIIIADNQFLITESLKQLIQQDGNYEVRKIVTGKQELFKILNQEPVSLLIADFNLIYFDGPSGLMEILNNFPELKLLIITNYISKNELLELNAIGIKNILLKTVGKEEIFEAIEATLRGKKYYSNEILDMLFESNKKGSLGEDARHLTTTEIEIVRLIADGLTTKGIAAHKHISFHTVITHRKNIFRKLNVSSISEMIMYAIKAGWISNIEYYI